MEGDLAGIPVISPTGWGGGGGLGVEGCWQPMPTLFLKNTNTNDVFLAGAACPGQVTKPSLQAAHWFDHVCQQLGVVKVPPFGPCLYHTHPLAHMNVRSAVGVGLSLRFSTLHAEVFTVQE